MSRFLLALFALMFLSGCTEIEYASHLAKRSRPDVAGRGTASAQQGNFKIGNPYKVEGQWYYPREEYDLVETGIASWYGPGFDGRHTANGEVFRKGELTAAHRTLQMPSLVRVTNLANGRAVIVRVNDRGPYKRGRVMDVSEKAAELLGFRGIGTAKVKIEVLRNESQHLAQLARTGASTRGYEVAMNQKISPAAMPAAYESAALEPVSRQPLQQPAQAAAAAGIPGHTTGGEFYPDPVVTNLPVRPTEIYVQAGSFTVYDNAVRQRDTLGSYSNASISTAQVNGRQFYRVRLGPVGKVDEADQLLARLVQAGQNSAIIVVE